MMIDDTSAKILANRIQAAARSLNQYIAQAAEQGMVIAVEANPDERVPTIRCIVMKMISDGSTP